MERLYNAVHTALEKKRTEENKKLFEDLDKNGEELLKYYEMERRNGVIDNSTEQKIKKLEEERINIKKQVQNVCENINYRKLQNALY